MKKRTVILLFGTLFFSVAGYVAWCLRSFYLTPRLEFEASVSPGGRRAAEEWAKTSGYPTRDSFEWSAAFAHLCHPWHALADTAVVVHEAPDTGLWATHRFRIWTFSKAKAGDGWEGSTARDRGSMPVVDFQRILGLERAASRIESLIAGEGTIEILSLAPEIEEITYSNFLKPRRAPDYRGDFMGTFYQHRILGRAMVEDGEERRELLGAFASAIRDADDIDFLCFNPRHAIIHTHGDQWTEYLICFECRQVEVFESSGDDWGFKVASRGGEVFAAYLDHLGIEQDRPGH